MENAISVSRLVKTFGSVRALDGLDLTVAEGEVHGFLGPNGAGKSTTIRVLLGLLRATAGDVRLQPAEGRSGRRARVRRRAPGARRADLGTRPADGGGLPPVHRGGAAGRPDGAAVE